MQGKAATTINQPIGDVYRAWRDLAALPRFMLNLESVTPLSERRSRWRAKPAAGITLEWEVDIVDDRPEEIIAWESIEGAEVVNSGAVRFAPAPGDRGTEVVAEVHFAVPGSALGEAVAKLFGEDPSAQLREGLRRLKQVLELGDVVRSDAAPEGPTASKKSRQRPAQPSTELEAAAV